MGDNVPDGTPQDNAQTDKGIGDIALKQGLVTELQLQEAMEAHATIVGLGINKRLSEVLVEKGLISEDQAEALHRAAASGGEAKILGGFELMSKLGEGGMGAVYKARQLSLDRIVALKILPPRLATNKEFIARFQREARVAAKLDHPNIIRALDVGEVKGTRYFSMEFVEGEDIGSKLDRDGSIAEGESIRLITQAAKALQHAHENDLIHRDIKPDNILITKDGVAKVADLGLARSTSEEATRMTVTGTAMGTPHYISPEQARGEKDLDIRTDIYSLGVTLFHMLAGKPPFEGSTAAIVITRRLTEEPPFLKQANPEVSEGLAHIVLKMMAREKEDRYTTPAELIEDLEALQSGESPPHAAGSPDERTLLWTPTGVQPSAAAAPQSSAPPLAPGDTRATDVKPGHPRAPGETFATNVASTRPGGLSVGAIAGIAAGAVIVIAVLLVALLSGSGETVEDPAEAEVRSILLKVNDLVAQGDRDKAIAKLEGSIPLYEGKAAQQKLKTRLADLTKLRDDARRLAEREEAARSKLEAARSKLEVAVALREAGKLAAALAKAKEAKAKYGETSVGPEFDELIAALEEDMDLARRAKTALERITTLEAKGELSAAGEMARAGVRDFEGTCHEPTFVDAVARLDEALAAREAADVEAKAAAELEAVQRLVDEARYTAAMERGADAVEKYAGTPSVPAIQKLIDTARGMLTEKLRAEQLAKTLGAAKVLEAEDKYAPALDAYGNALALAVDDERPPIVAAVERVRQLVAYQAAMADGRARVEAKEWDRATSAVSRALAVKPDDPAALALLALIDKERAAAVAVEKPPTDVAAEPTGDEPEDEKTADATARVPLAFVPVRGGEYVVGDNRGARDERPARKVRLDAFLISVHEITNAQYEEFDPDHAGRRSGASPGDNHPVAAVTWGEAMAFCAWLSSREGVTCRLPTEAEWEAAARGADGRKYAWGDVDADAGGVYRANWGQGKTRASWRRDGFVGAAPVGSFPAGASPVGCLDMAGNVWEWCLDGYDAKSYARAAKSPKANPRGPMNSRERVLRGGSWSHDIELARAANRHRAKPDIRHGSIGFRVVKETSSR